MTILATILVACVAQTHQSTTSLPGVPGATPRPRPAIATVEGATPLQAIGLYDAKTGQFFRRRLAPEVAGIVGLELLPIDHVGRSELTSQIPGSPRLRTDVAGASRLELPENGGTLYHYRSVNAGQWTYGVLHVGPDGVPRVALAQPALPGGAGPFLPWVAVGPHGRAVLVGTKREAGGDLIELDLVARTSTVRTSGVGPLTLGRDGLWLGETWGFGVSRDGIQRFARSPGAVSEVVPVLGGAPALWRGDAAMSLSRNAAVAVGGSSASALLPFVFGAQGPARRGATMPGRISPAGYAPDSTFGPFLAVSDDAATCAWRIELIDPFTQLPFQDMVVGRAAAAFPPVTVTGDTYLLDTLDEVGRVFFTRIGELLYAAGEPNDPTEGGLEAADVFGAVLDAAGTPSIRNVSATSGQTTMPFLTGIPLWTPAVVVLIDEDVALIHEDDARQLVALDLVTGTITVVLDQVREVLWVEGTGAQGGWCAAVERDSQMREMQIVGAASGTAFAVVLDSGTPATVYRGPVSPRSSSAAAVAYVRSDFGLEHVKVSRPDVGQTVSWSTSPGAITLPLSFVGSRRLAFTRQAGLNGDEQRVWSFLGSSADLVLNAPLRPSFLLR